MRNLIRIVESASGNPLLSMSREELERQDIDDLDRLAFGHLQGETIVLKPAQIRIKYHRDLANPQARFDRDGMRWVRSVDFSEPVHVSIGRNGKFFLEDGHHRWFAARKLRRDLPALIVKIDGNPIDVILQRKEK